jgi:hypothetical protein
VAQNKVVVHYQDGRILKGFVADFFPDKEVFHLAANDAPEAKVIPVRVADLKALFFVKDFMGNADYHARRNQFWSGRPVVSRKIQVVFKDGETLLGTTQGYQAGRTGFFLVPADAESNNERCFVVLAATSNVSFV